MNERSRSKDPAKAALPPKRRGMRLMADVPMTAELFKDICDRVAEGESLLKILGLSRSGSSRVPGMPSYCNFFLTMKEQPEFREMYEFAKQLSAHVDADRIAMVADETLKGKHDARRAAVAIDALKWAAAHKAPMNYGKTVTVDHTGSVKVEKVTVEFVAPGAVPLKPMPTLLSGVIDAEAEDADPLIGLDDDEDDEDE